MSAISHSVQQFSDKDEERELAELTEKEKEDILDDIYGRRSPTDNATNAAADDDSDDDITEELLDEYVDALVAIPSEDKENYMFALDHFPHLIREEAHPTCFLRASKYDPQLAAKRQVEYWNMRLKVFEEHAFDRMSLDGAMKHLIPVMVQIPNLLRILPEDYSGRTVFCFDKTNTPRFNDFEDTTLLKILWFVIHLALQRRLTQKQGIVVICINRGSNWDFPSHNVIKLTSKSMYRCLPVKICCRHACLSSLLLTCVLPTVKYLMPRDARRRLQVHNCIKNATLLHELEMFGLHRSYLPKSIGGTYDEKPTWVVECEHILKEQRRRNKRQREGKTA